MSFWTFVDRNARGLFMLALAAVYFGTLLLSGHHGDEGCRLKIGDAPSAALADGGAP